MISTKFDLVKKKGDCRGRKKGDVISSLSPQRGVLGAGRGQLTGQAAKGKFFFAQGAFLPGIFSGDVPGHKKGKGGILFRGPHTRAYPAKGR